MTKVFFKFFQTKQEFKLVLEEKWPMQAGVVSNVYFTRMEDIPEISDTKSYYKKTVDFNEEDLKAMENKTFEMKFDLEINLEHDTVAYFLGSKGN